MRQPSSINYDVNANKQDSYRKAIAFLSSRINGGSSQNINWRNVPQVLGELHQWMAANPAARKERDYEGLFKVFNIDRRSFVHSTPVRTVLRRRLLRKAAGVMRSPLREKSEEKPVGHQQPPDQAPSRGLFSMVLPWLWGVPKTRPLTPHNHDAPTAAPTTVVQQLTRSNGGSRRGREDAEDESDNDITVYIRDCKLDYKVTNEAEDKYHARLLNLYDRFEKL
ncbi:hypothetical protein BC567DRAFT_212967 [Phyllosticta citribraziliensis]